MKKICFALVLALIILSFSGCRNDGRISIGDSIFDVRKEHQMVCQANGLDVFRTETGYVAVISDGRKVLSVAEFSENRKPERIAGIALKTFDDISTFLGMEIDDIEAAWGTRHFDASSGISMPSYITEDAYMVVLKLGIVTDAYLPGSFTTTTVTAVMKVDLFTDEVVEELY